VQLPAGIELEMASKAFQSLLLLETAYRPHFPVLKTPVCKASFILINHPLNTNRHEKHYHFRDRSNIRKPHFL
jgi:hypothetical protein